MAENEKLIKDVDRFNHLEFEKKIISPKGKHYAYLVPLDGVTPKLMRTLQYR